MIVVDVETTGLFPEKHSIVSIGALDFFNPLNQFYQENRIWDGAEITQEALSVNGFTGQQIKDINKKSLEESIKDFSLWANDLNYKTLAGHNPVFDTEFLKASAKRYGIKWNFGRIGIDRTLDLHTLCYSHYLRKDLMPPTKNNVTALNLDKVLNYVGLPDEPKPHNALRGAKMEAEAFSRLIYGRLLFKEFKNFPVPDYLLK